MFLFIYIFIHFSFFLFVNCSFDNSISDHTNEILNRYKSDIILYETFETQKSKDIKFRSPESLSAIVLIEEIKKDNFSEPVFTVEDVPQFCFDLSVQHVVQTKLQFNVEEDNDETVATKKQKLDCFFNDDIISLNHFHVVCNNQQYWLIKWLNKQISNNSF